MRLTEINKKRIDDLSYEQMLKAWRFSKIGDPFFEGETGEYYSKRMQALRAEPGGEERHVAASKALGWSK